MRNRRTCVLKNLYDKEVLVLKVMCLPCSLYCIFFTTLISSAKTSHFNKLGCVKTLDSFPHFDSSLLLRVHHIYLFKQSRSPNCVFIHGLSANSYPLLSVILYFHFFQRLQDFLYCESYRCVYG